jgi:hypothetical protein
VAFKVPLLSDDHLLVAMSELGQSLPGRARTNSGHVRYIPIATKFCIAAKWRDGPKH